MHSAFLRYGLSLAALSAAATMVSSCATGPTQAEREAEAARVAAEAAALANAPPPITLDEGVARDAAVYVAFTREMAAIEGGFATPEAVQAALTKGAAYNPEQLSRGLVAYASIMALQSPEFVAGVRQYAAHAPTREKMIADIVADPRYASVLPGADAAAALITATLRRDIDALGRAANSIENDAYAIQAAHDPRRPWGVAQVPDREGRLAGAKARSGEPMTAPADETARLLAAARTGGTEPATGTRRKPPYPPIIENALALAALAALGAAGENARANIDALQNESVSQRCLTLSKLNLFQCLAASRPSYEDMFCVGRHIVRDIATCTRGSAMPAPIVSVSAVTPLPAVTPAPFIATPGRLDEAEPPAPTRDEPAREEPAPPAARPAPAPQPTPASPSSLTERLNTQPTQPD